LVLVVNDNGEKFFMTQQRELDSLTAKHQSLEEQIGEEQSRPVPDTLKLQSLKRQKLKVKERKDELLATLRTSAIAA
jgi:hypothetical protein